MDSAVSRMRKDISFRFLFLREDTSFRLCTRYPQDGESPTIFCQATNSFQLLFRTGGIVVLGTWNLCVLTQSYPSWSLNAQQLIAM